MDKNIQINHDFSKIDLAIKKGSISNLLKLINAKEICNSALYGQHSESLTKQWVSKYFKNTSTSNVENITNNLFEELKSTLNKSIPAYYLTRQTKLLRSLDHEARVSVRYSTIHSVIESYHPDTIEKLTCLANEAIVKLNEKSLDDLEKDERWKLNDSVKQKIAKLRRLNMC